jgi:hypothetical protein
MRGLFLRYVCIAGVLLCKRLDLDRSCECGVAEIGVHLNRWTPI